MRIAQVSPLFESVPPKFYGGTERVVFHLTEELVRRGHEVTLFASGDSETSARLVSGTPNALRLTGRDGEHLAHCLLMMECIFESLDQFDIIHFHTDYLQFPLLRRHKTPNLTTMHGRLDIPGLVAFHSEFTEMPLVSISDSQRSPMLHANWIGTVYHGYPPQLFRFSPSAGDYVAFLGRISPEKRVDRAIEIAIGAGIPLKIAAKVDPVDRSYFERAIQPMLSHPLVEYIGEIGDGAKSDFLGGAKALLFPIDWPEPFGLVMIEALACGTPVLAYPCGSVPEVIEHGKTGFLVGSVEEAVKCLLRIDEISRYNCRSVFEQRFSVASMAEGYLGLYESITGKSNYRTRAISYAS